MENEIVKQKEGKLFIVVVCLFIFLIIIIGVASTVFVYTKEKSGINTISTGNIYLNYNESTNGISITNAYPVNDEVGKSLSDENYYFDFSINSVINGDVKAFYEISAIKDETSTLSNNEVKLYLEKEENNVYKEVMAPKHFTPINSKTELGSIKGSMILTEGVIDKSSTDNYRLRMWVDSNAILGEFEKTFKVKVAVVAKMDLNK